MVRPTLSVCLAISIAVPLSAAEPPSHGMTGSTSAISTAKSISPGGRGPARPRGKLAAVLPAKGKPAVLPVYPPFAGGPALAPQPPIHIALYGKTRPILIRVLTKVDGKELAAAWNDHVETLFRAFDRNGDGYLNRFEFEYVFSPAGVVKLPRKARRTFRIRMATSARASKPPTATKTGGYPSPNSGRITPKPFAKSVVSLGESVGHGEGLRSSVSSHLRNARPKQRRSDYGG